MKHANEPQQIIGHVDHFPSTSLCSVAILLLVTIKFPLNFWHTSLNNVKWFDILLRKICWPLSSFTNSPSTCSSCWFSCCAVFRRNFSVRLEAWTSFCSFLDIAPNFWSLSATCLLVRVSSALVRVRSSLISFPVCAVLTSFWAVTEASFLVAVSSFLVWSSCALVWSSCVLALRSSSLVWFASLIVFTSCLLVWPSSSTLLASSPLVWLNSSLVWFVACVILASCWNMRVMCWSLCDSVWTFLSFLINWKYNHQN